MRSSALLAAVAALAPLAAALNYTTSGPLNITASQIPISLREVWCNAQRVSCPEICGGQAFPNTCNTDTLSYKCVCTDGSHPNISAYMQTLPFYVCEQWKTNCIKNHPNNLVGIDACMSVTCGTKNASTVGAPGPTSSGAAGPSASSPPSGSAGGGGPSASASSSSTSSNFAAIATHFAQEYGTHVLAGGMLAAFGLAL